MHSLVIASEKGQITYTVAHKFLFIEKEPNYFELYVSILRDHAQIVLYFNLKQISHVIIFIVKITYTLNYAK